MIDRSQRIATIAASLPYHWALINHKLLSLSMYVIALIFAIAAVYQLIKSFKKKDKRILRIILLTLTALIFLSLPSIFRIHGDGPEMWGSDGPEVTPSLHGDDGLNKK